MSEKIDRKIGTSRDESAVYAAIDLGTNNCRLLIASPGSGGSNLTILGSYSRIVRLGEGLTSQNRLSAHAMGRTLNALRVCAQRIEACKATRIHCVATEACRRADNGVEFLNRVTQETGLPFEIISPQQEAELTLHGCQPLFSPEKRHTLLFDIGGGSTEIVWANTAHTAHPVLQDTVSFPIGVVTLSETYESNQIDDRRYQQIRADVSALLEPFDTKHKISDAISAGDVQMIGTSGTVTTLGALILNLLRYDRSRVDGLEMNFQTIHRIITNIVQMDPSSRQKIPCIGPDRADLMVMGCAILDAICAKWPVGRLRAADRGIREGLLLEMMEKDRQDKGSSEALTNASLLNAPAGG